MPTIVEVAKRAQVSTATVSNVIRGTQRVSAALRERVNEAIQNLDYHPNELARGLKMRKTGILGMVLPDITNPFFPEIMRGAEDTAMDRGYFLLTANTDEQIERERRIVSALRSYRVDGVLLASAPGKNTTHIRRTIDSGIPVVYIDRTPAGIKADSVLLDNVRGAREGVRHLISRGYRKIAMITGPQQVLTGRERLRGYKDALREAGIPLSPKFILEGDSHEESGYRLGKKILSYRAIPSAIFVSNGPMALGLLRAFDELKVRCPGEVAVVTFDDLAMFRTSHPQLTAVVQPSYEIGVRAATILIDRVEAKLTSGPVCLRVQPTLILRESSEAQPRKSAQAGD
jgi:LacI family transcriptional regulator, galactose operon repressor